MSIWSWDMVGVPEARRALPHHQFTIIQSSHGAMRGDESDDNYDYISIHSGKSDT